MSKIEIIEEDFDTDTKPSTFVKETISSSSSKSQKTEETADNNNNNTLRVHNRGPPRNPLTKQMIIESCLKNGYYRTPSCNERLYLHFKGLDSLGSTPKPQQLQAVAAAAAASTAEATNENNTNDEPSSSSSSSPLEEYTEVLCAWLEGNCLCSLEGIEHLPKLRCLYVHQNMLEEITHLEPLKALDSLNISENYIRKLSGLDSQAETLSTLQMKNNKLKTAEDYEHLRVLQVCRTLDISNNDIVDGQDLLEVLKDMPNLKALYVAGNPFVRDMRNFRKTMLAALPNLLHLDDKPVFDDERRLVNAWARGGLEAEKEECKKLRQEEENAAKQRLEDFRKLVAAAKAEKMAAEDSANKEDADDAEDQDTESEVDSNPTPDSTDNDEDQDNGTLDENQQTKNEENKKIRNEKIVIANRKKERDIEKNRVLTSNRATASKNGSSIAAGNADDDDDQDNNEASSSKSAKNEDIGQLAAEKEAAALRKQQQQQKQHQDPSAGTATGEDFDDVFIG